MSLRDLLNSGSSSSVSPEEHFEKVESQLAEKIWNIIEEEETDIESLEKLEMENPSESDIRGAERALKSLAVGVQQDIEKLEEGSEELEVEIENSEIDSDVKQALEHNLRLIVSVSHHLEAVDGFLGQRVSEVEQESGKEEVEDLLTVEERAENKLARIEREMQDGGDEFDRGWISLS